MSPKKLAKLKHGAKLMLKCSKQYRQFYWDKAWEMNKLYPGGLPTEKDALGYLEYIFLHFCMEKKVKFLAYGDDVGDEEPGAHVEILFPKGLKGTSWISHKFIR